MHDGETSSSRLEIRLLGPFDARVGPDAIPPLRTRKGQHLLALLALRYPCEVQREWLAANLWPDSFLDNAYYNLRREISNVRTVLGTGKRHLSSPTAHSLRLDPGAELFVDVHRFDALMIQGDVRSLQEAVALYRGPLLEGWPEDWIVPFREARRQACLNALELLATEAERRDDWPDAVRWLKRLVALDPLQDEGQRRLIDSLAHKGDFTAAVVVYREYRERLRREMDADPSGETTAAFRRVVAEASRVSASQKLVTASEEPDEIAGSLPRPLTSFVGRVRELEELHALLASARLITILGSGALERLGWPSG